MQSLFTPYWPELKVLFKILIRVGKSYVNFRHLLRYMIMC